MAYGWCVSGNRNKCLSVMASGWCVPDKKDKLSVVRKNGWKLGCPQRKVSGECQGGSRGVSWFGAQMARGWGDFNRVKVWPGCPPGERRSVRWASEDPIYERLSFRLGQTAGLGESGCELRLDKCRRFFCWCLSGQKCARGDPVRRGCVVKKGIGRLVESRRGPPPFLPCRL